MISKDKTYDPKFPLIPYYIKKWTKFSSKSSWRNFMQPITRKLIKLCTCIIYNLYNI